jgi:pimeloyl-ACP methyl ester carboxylesterase
MAIKTLALAGERQQVDKSPNAHYPGLVQKSSILLAGAVRGNAEPQTEKLSDGDLVELEFDDGIKWFGPSDMLEDLFPGGLQRNRDGEEVFEITGDLEHPDATRGFGKAVLKVLNVFAREKGKEEEKEKKKSLVKELAAHIERKILGMDVGLWSVRDNLSLVPYEEPNTAAPILLLLHGTGSSTQSSFEGLPGTSLWKYWQDTYGKNILAFQHETLSKSPLENVADLVKKLPANARLHLVSHSRGGLVGEVLCRFSQQDSGDVQGFADVDINAFKEAGQGADADAITALRNLANDKQYKVEKFVRVACPAAGTTILAKRLDYFVNILLNLIGTASGAAVNPIYTAFQELLVMVVDQKNDPDVLPGLEAMKPDSLFIRLLNNQSGSISIAPPVAVVSGNCKIGFNLKSLFVIVSKLYYWEDNDLIVNTRSMYAGSKKTNGLQYFFDEGSKVDHFHYFKNEKTNAALLLAFKASGTAAIDGFTALADSKLGDAERNAALGLEGGQYFSDNPSGKKPIVLLLPGIMGSSLHQEGDRIWINYLRFLTGGLRRLDIGQDKVTAPAIISTSYKALAEHLKTDYDVVTFPYDWRRPLPESAASLNEKIKKLLLLKQPIKIIGHSMGGVLVRDFILAHDSTWKTLKDMEGFRLIFLGSPLGGSYRILNVLFGRDELIKKLDMVDVAHGMKGLLNIFSRFPGILNLLPLTTDADNDFAKLSVWQAMAKHIGDNGWPIPTENDLKAFAQYRQTVLNGQPNIDFSKAIYVAGRDRFTPCGYRRDTTARGNELTFLSTGEGDQSVTWDSGIPAAMKKENTYYVNVTHGSLASATSMFIGIRELLAKGETNLFNRNRPTVRSTEKIFKQPEVSDFDLSPRGVENTLLGIGQQKTMAAGELPVKIRVSHGDLKYAEYPLLAGHFKNDSILYAEKAINRLLKGLLAERHSVGLYPGDIGTSEILLTQQSEGFEGAVIVGLGEPGTLNSFGLTRSIEQAVARYLLMINGRDKLKNPLHHKTPLGISSLIIGCGYGGLTIENSISAIVEGILLANQKIKNLYQENAKLIERIQFVELYEDRLLACYYTVYQLCTHESGFLNITNEPNGVEKLKGGRKRIGLLQQEEWWNRIEVRTSNEKKGAAKGIRFVLGTNRAMQDSRDVFTTTSMVEKLAKVISTDSRWDTAKARALYELLLPHDFKDEVKKSGNIVWVLDEYTAGFPWELLHDKTTGARPLCIDSGMIRQLVVEDGGRVKIDMAQYKTALVVGDPNLQGFVTQLPGALEEAKAVTTLLEQEGYDTKVLLRSSPEDIIPALFSNDYKIIHLAGHGEFNEDPEKESGMIIGNGVFLTTGEIAQISGTSELVFVNCCFLGKTDGHAESLYQQRYKLAANIGTQLIKNGVKAVVAAGWAVDDAAALDFAKRFYASMFEGYPFGEAVRMARDEIYNKHGDTNTWGAYQCYGDPFYRLLNDRDKQAGNRHYYVLSAQAEIDLENLFNDLSTADPGEDTTWALKQLQKISKEVDECKLRNQAITEKEAFVLMELNKNDEAVAKFEELQGFKEASYSFVAIEKYYRLRAKKLYNMADAHQMSVEERDAAFDGVLKGLDALVHIRPTAERYSQMGSTHKKKMSLIEVRDANGKEDKEMVKAVVKEMEAAAEHYYTAYRHSGDTEAGYPFVNWAELQILLVNAGVYQWDTAAAKGKKKEDKPHTPAAIRQRLDFFKDKFPNAGTLGEYYDIIEPANIEFCKWLLQFTDGKAKPVQGSSVIKLYERIWSKGVAETDKKEEMDHLNMLLMGAKIGKNNKMAKALEELIASLQGLV